MIDTNLSWFLIGMALEEILIAILGTIIGINLDEKDEQRLLGARIEPYTLPAIRKNKNSNFKFHKELEYNDE
jgi:hypothetical protein